MIITNRDFALMNAVKYVFLEASSLLCPFHIEKNVKAKCKIYVASKNKRLIHNSMGDLCKCWNVMKNLITLQHTEIKASFEKNIHFVGITKGRASKFERSTKRDPSYIEHVDALYFVHDSSFNWKSFKASGQKLKLAKIHKTNIHMLDQFHVNLHPYILGIVDVKANGHCGYRAIWVKNAWPIMHNNLLKELGQWRDEYVIIFGSLEGYDVIKRSLLESMDKWMTKPNMGYIIVSRSQPPTNTSVHRLICVDLVNANHYDCCPIPNPNVIWSTHCHLVTKEWFTPYIGRIQ
ncbi:hypothetical protein GmHk_17G049971 [Glycine max]|nr:hypothetical protein GmHk_17G049971 [Glycine max]